MAKATNLSNHVLGLACFALVVAMAGAAQFKVGGDNGWRVPGANAESYNTWAERTRFQIGDSLAFVYPKDKDSVLLVEPADYNACNTSSYVRKFDDGNTAFAFDRSGAFFFISGVEAHCRASEKLIVMVLAGRNGTGGAPLAPPPESSTPPPSSSPPPSTSSPPPATSPSPPPAPAPTVPTLAPPTAAAPTTPSTPPSASSPPAPATASPPSYTPSGPASSPPAPSSANAPSAGGNSTGTSPPPAGSSNRNGAGLTVAAGLVSSTGACIIGYAMLAL